MISPCSAWADKNPLPTKRAQDVALLIHIPEVLRANIILLTDLLQGGQELLDHLWIPHLCPLAWQWRGPRC